MENTARRQPEVDRACKPKTPPAGTKEPSSRKPSRQLKTPVYVEFITFRILLSSAWNLWYSLLYLCTCVYFFVYFMHQIRIYSLRIVPKWWYSIFLSQNSQIHFLESLSKFYIHRFFLFTYLLHAISTCWFPLLNQNPEPLSFFPLFFYVNIFFFFFLILSNILSFIILGTCIFRFACEFVCKFCSWYV